MCVTPQICPFPGAPPLCPPHVPPAGCSWRAPPSRTWSRIPPSPPRIPSRIPASHSSSTSDSLTSVNSYQQHIPIYSPVSVILLLWGVLECKLSGVQILHPLRICFPRTGNLGKCCLSNFVPCTGSSVQCGLNTTSVQGNIELVGSVCFSSTRGTVSSPGPPPARPLPPTVMGLVLHHTASSPSSFEV